MGNPYSQPTLTGYNSNPPSDDGSQTAANTVKWATHKDKIGDPLKTFAQAMDGNVATAFGKVFGNTVNSQSTAYTIQSSDQGALIDVTSAATITLIEAATAGSNFTVSVLNRSSGDVTLDGNLAETINGTLTQTLAPNEFAILICDGSNWRMLAGAPLSSVPLPRSYLAGYGVSNNVTDADHDLDIAAGQARDNANALNMERAAITKQIDAAWAEGDDAGGFPTGITLAIDTWYRVFLIVKADGTVDAGFDTSSTAANLLADASAYTGYRQIGWRKSDGTSNLISVIQRGDFHYPVDPGTLGLDISNESVGASEVTVTLANCPPECEALINVGVSATEQGEVWVYETDRTSSGVARDASVLPSIALFPNASTGTTATMTGQVRVWVDASRQVHLRAGQSGRTVDLQVMGWWDRRGRDD